MRRLPRIAPTHVFIHRIIDTDAVAADRGALHAGGTPLERGDPSSSAVSGSYDPHVLTERRFEKFGFSPRFDATLDPEFPGDGDWHCEVFGFGRSGQIEPEFRSVWGTPMVVEVTSSTIPRWIGNFAAGGLGGVTGLFATPGAFQLCAVADGLAYVVDVRRPDLGATPVQDQVVQVVATERGGVVLVVGPTDIVALGPTCVTWRTERLAVDDLRVVKVSGDLIECRCSMGGSDADEILGINLLTGRQTAGTRFDGLWAPDALA